MTKDELLRQLDESMGDDVEALTVIAELIELLAKRRASKEQAA
jgi:hypothetical protein